MTDVIDKKQDLWLAAQLDAVNDIQCPTAVDVADKVMKQVRQRPMLTKAPVKHIVRRYWLSGAAAACVVGIVLLLPHITDTELDDKSGAALSTGVALSERVDNFYSFCQDYAASEEAMAASYNTNPIQSLFNI